MDRFADKVVLITGAASGIGRATAERLAAEGATLALSDVNAEGLEETADTCRAAGSKVFSAVSNVADEASVADLVASAVAEHGRLDVAINVAGVLHFEDLRRTKLEDWDRIIAVNLTGTFLVCREVMDHLLATGGNIVNTASTASLAGHPWAVSYSASKGGVYALTQCLAVEFGKQGVRCNSVAPGSILTPIQNEFRLPEGADIKLVNRITALDTHRGPETVASTIAFLASDDAAHVNGTCVKVDGGTLA
ncbi:SDR family NAD(P)-dependent oxidoreductase [Dermatobacter hominis]|uniref:SDR family NAD(P)-dependent oxidoreductase n=1 Tax=Dermatobacter hominis TaxID=2884263 RepID=UPI001D11D9EC|nr:SDR family NAD(P)-dependent oxidoreductase [Dermatobacter hominis]UDY35600.1 SDR family oxidoreductase [Dermatobacter hominis]